VYGHPAASQLIDTQWDIACGFQTGALLSSMNVADTSAVALLERDRSFEGETYARVMEAFGGWPDHVALHVPAEFSVLNCFRFRG
jgi:ABC-type transporter Mla maintaining outer membrane lipid asymmetry ATPase subunit MlaF